MEGLKEFFSRIGMWIRIPTMHLTDVLEIIIIAFIVYNLIKWVRSTRAWMPVKGLMLLLVFWFIASILEMDVILWIFYNTIGVGITAIIIVFHPEIRRALEQLGQQSITSPLRIFSEGKEKEERFSERTIEEIVKGVFLLARHKTGALIVIEQEVSLSEYEETGIAIDSLISNQLLINIFEHNTPLHDGAMIIRDGRVAAAGCVLPLSESSRLSLDLGTRHRAGVGMSEATDAVVVIVSEETGVISVAVGGILKRHLAPKTLERLLRNELCHEQKEQNENLVVKLLQRLHVNEKGGKQK